MSDILNYNAIISIDALGLEDALTIKERLYLNKLIAKAHNRGVEIKIKYYNLKTQ